MNRPRSIVGVLGSATAILIPALCSAQQSGAAIATSLLRPSTDTIAVTVEAQGRVIPFATAFRSVRATRFRGVDALEMTYQWRGNDGSSTADTLWVAAKDLAPIENHRHNGLQDAVTTFERKAAHTRFTTKDKSEQRADTSVTDVLYASGELEDLIRAAPLTIGYRGGYTLYYGPPGRLARPASFAVVRSEMVKARSGQLVDCWVVDAPLSEGLNTFFVSKMDRRVIRLVNHEDPNAAFIFTK